MTVCLGLAGCEAVSRLFPWSSDAAGYWLPLTVELRLDPSVTEAALDYIDACHQGQRLSIGDPLRESFKREIGMVFERVHVVAPAGSGDQVPPGSGRAHDADGVVEIALGLKELDLFIAGQGTRTYTATVTLGAIATYVDPNGEVVYSKKLRTERQGTVSTEEGRCEVRGLAAVAAEAAAILAQGFRKHLGTSTKIREAAQAKAAGSTPTAGAVLNQPSNGVVQGPAAISFRAMVQDSNANELLESGERISVEVEVTNAGPGLAKDVVVRLNGSPALAQGLPSSIPVGDLQPGQSKRAAAIGQIPLVVAAQEAELTVAVETVSAISSQLDQKRFLIRMQPREADGHAGAQARDVDRIPEPNGPMQPGAIGVVVGIGRFRDAHVPGIPFATHDAEVMAGYFRAVMGVPPDRIRLATNEYALKEDLAEIFEEWLPQEARPGGTVYIFIASRAAVNPSTGAVSLLPYEADPAASLHLFSLRRLYDALARLPIERAVLFLDLSLSEDSAVEGNGKQASWSTVPPALRGGKLIRMIGVNGAPEPHQYEQGGHGLFTYALLKGLGGAADADRNGIIEVGEMCEFLRMEFQRVAKDREHPLQAPVCLPPLRHHEKVAKIQLGRVKIDR